MCTNARLVELRLLRKSSPHDVGSVLRVGVEAVLVGEYHARVGFFHFNPCEVGGVEDRTLEELDLGEVSLEQRFQFQVGRHTECEKGACILWLPIVTAEQVFIAGGVGFCL